MAHSLEYPPRGSGDFRDKSQPGGDKSQATRRFIFVMIAFRNGIGDPVGDLVG
jgi:hypothetical protein